MADRRQRRDSEVERLTFQEQMELLKIPAETQSTGQNNAGAIRRYMSTRAAWLPGSDLPRDPSGRHPLGKPHEVAFGGQVYSQSALAVCRAWREEEDKLKIPEDERLGLHTIHGYFTAGGNPYRPFLYTVNTTTASRTFSTLSVLAHQPTQPSHSTTGDHFPREDASLLLAPTPCFHAICSFKRPEPHSGDMTAQQPPPQARYAAILAQRLPQDWPPSPPIDIDLIVGLVGDGIVGSFPVVEMRKVRMDAFNADKPLHERRELILYRLLAPLPADGTDGWDANAHVLVHAYEADRNGLLMLGNNVGFGRAFGRAASLSYTLVVHTDAREAVMRFDEQDEKGNGWWVQEISFPRAGSGRGIVMSTIWSPRGLHVATEYQDGLCRTHGGKWEVKGKI